MYIENSCFLGDIKLPQYCAARPHAWISDQTTDLHWFINIRSTNLQPGEGFLTNQIALVEITSSLVKKKKQACA